MTLPDTPDEFTPLPAAEATLRAALERAREQLDTHGPTRTQLARIADLERRLAALEDQP